ncbi:MAG: DNA adenine methylase, partial [Desulfobacteraceae bacterium]|nr:DNA adenine methylase [Desulfobacteraceae bacterium]
TEGIKYAGSKLKILPYIIEIVKELSGVKNVLDGFSGSTRVSQTFAQLGCHHHKRMNPPTAEKWTLPTGF